MICGSIIRKVCALASTAIGKSTGSPSSSPKMECVKMVTPCDHKQLLIMQKLYTRLYKTASISAAISGGARGIILNGILAPQKNLVYTNVILKPKNASPGPAQKFSGSW